MVRFPICVRCGHCCSTGMCTAGEDDGTGKCRFFKEDNIELGTFICEIRDRIMKIEENSKYPMFENYCCSPLFNFTRQKVIKKMNDEVCGNDNK